MRQSKTPSLDFCLKPEQQSDKVKMVTNRKCRKEKVSKKGNIIKISKRRKATLRTDGRYQVYAVLDGKRKACYGTTEYKANCRADIEEADQDIKEILSTDKRYIFEYCFYRYRNYLLFYTALEAQTVDRYEATYLKYFQKRALNQKDIRKLVSKDISEFLISVMDEYERLTVKEYQRIRHIIQAVLDFVYDEELDTEDDVEPAFDWNKIRRRIPKGKIYKTVKHEYAVSSSEKMLLQDKVIEENIYPEKFAYVLMILINFSLGLRVGELAALTVDDIDMRRHVVYINKSCKSHKERDEYGNPVGQYVYTVDLTKTPKGIRAIPMSETAQMLFHILLQYRKEKGYRSKYLAYDGENIRARTRAMTDILRKLCERSEVEYFNSHIIRKSFATNLSRCPDIDIATIAEYMGHAQVSTTLNKYIIPAREDAEERIKQISKFI